MSQAAQTARVSRARAESVPVVLHHSPPYRWAFAAAVALFALYAFTLAPTTAFWDTSEYIATAHILGIPHPPGNPLFVLLARAWELLLTPFGLPVAVRINLFSAFMSAGAAFFWFLLVHRILAFFTPSETVRRVGAFASVWVSGTAFTVWNQSNVNEKVYTVTLFTIAAMSWIAFLWRDHVEEHRGQRNGRFKDDNAILLVVFILALSVGNHLMAFLAAPALLVFLLLVKPASLANWKLYPGLALVAVLGLSVQLYLPIRANQDPVINEAAPKCASAMSSFTAVVTMGRMDGECPDLGAALRREQYQKPDWKSERMAPFGNQMANFFQYFDWQWSRSFSGTDGYFGAGRLPFTLVFLALGVWGAIQNYQRDRKSFWYVAVLFFTLSVGLVIYMNFKNGYMQAQQMGLQSSEVRERDYFYIITFSVWGLWVGVGLSALWLQAAESLRATRSAAAAVTTSLFPAFVVGMAVMGLAVRGGVGTGLAAGYGIGAGLLFLAGWAALGATFVRRERYTLAAASVMAIALVPTATNALYASRAGDYAARDFAYNVLQSVEPYGVLITNGDNDTFPLWYLQEVEGIRRDVTVIVMSYFNTPWYVQQLRDITRPCPRPGAALEDPTVITCQRPFQPSASTPFYNNLAKVPTRPILGLSDAEIQSIAANAFFQTNEGDTFVARGITFPLPPGQQLQPAHYFLTMMLQGAWGDRPIYFAATTNTHMELGLLGQVTRQGMAFKLLGPNETAGLAQMPMEASVVQFTGGYFDPARNEQLFNRVFMWRNMPDRAVWPDDATRNIPMQYYYAFAAAATAAQLRGDAAATERYTQRANGFADLANKR
ncbi:DUF2723 domain-containing protein [Longimicrobium sp.]|uniref:glycosyltransferase family 117 protein n=1 Tax=Longimicrobium sp. TaxID=2029185 RepID=UPI002E32B15C|nr:DUF2723 domain-containing protein [Longimicrobium sp.]HEX6041419.1 DUF2723 domain-containing protein [Longimicrobium sp.]